MKLGRKILAGYMGIALMVAVLGGINFRFTSEIKKDLDELRTSNVGELTGCVLLIDHLTGIQTNLKKLLLFTGMDNPDEIRLMKENIYQDFSGVENGLSELEAATKIGVILGDEDKKKEENQELSEISHIDKMLKSHLSMVRMMIARIQTEGYRDAGAYFHEEVEPSALEILVRLKKLRLDALEEAAHEANTARWNAKKSETFNIISAMVIIIASFVVGLLAAGAFTKPIVKLKEAAAAVGEGALDALDARVDHMGSGDEFGELAEAFNKMTRDLNSRVAPVDDLNREIARREKAERELQKSEERFQEVLEHSRDILFKRNIDTGEYEYFSNAVSRLTGCGPAEGGAMVGRVFEEGIHPEDLPKYRRFSEDVMKSNPSGDGDHVIEYRRRDADGEHRWLSAWQSIVREPGGRPKFVLGANRDITAQKNAEIALKKAQKTMLTVLDSMDAHVCVVDMESGEILLGNKKMREHIGRDLPGELCWKAFYDKDKPCDNCISGELLDADGRPAGTRTWEYRNPINDKWYIKNARAVKWTDGRYVRLQIAVDITRLKQMEADRLEAEERLRHSCKLEAVGAMAAGVAHNFNNLLMAVLGNLDLALEELSDDSRVKRNIHGAVSSANRAAELSSLMLTYIGQGKCSLETMDLSRALEGMADKLQASISKKSRLKFRLSPGPAVFDGDPEQVRQVVFNLTANASEAMEETGGEIIISTGIGFFDPDYFKAQVMKEELPAGRYVYVEVADAGPGMDGETIGKVLDPFFTTKFIGRGLGMAAVAGVMRTHKGAISLESAPGEGAVSRALFPALENQTMETEAPGPAAPAEPLSEGGSILLVDDEDITLTVGRAMLEKRGFDVLVAEDGPTAVETFREHESRICLVVLDLLMPGMDGVEVFTELRKIAPGVRVIIASGHMKSQVAERFTDATPAGYIHKPFNLKEISKTIGEVLGRSDLA
ncbi:MAG: response regulator [Desulfobacterales bacterium]|nr:response regulator [Desulfobacterales bacterium]